MGNYPIWYPSSRLKQKYLQINNSFWSEVSTEKGGTTINNEIISCTCINGVQNLFVYQPIF
jgi:hypothetical protein